MSAQIRRLADGRRLHLHHGPIDVVLEAWGAPEEVARAEAQAVATFPEVLPTLCRELARLRAPVDGTPFTGPVAERMRRASADLAAPGVFLTPMAAVAGAVADHLLAALCAGCDLEKAYVNDGGDIAFHLSPGASLSCGLVADPALPSIDGRFALTHALPVRGLATSGRATKGQGGRSFSLGIADAVTVLARDAAAADAAATLIANAVDLPGHPAIMRAPAHTLDPDSDLGARPVTVGLGSLSDAEIDAALARGRDAACALGRAGRLHAAVLILRGRSASFGLAPHRLAA
jgi:ApbE superfamily uncharacterized protein (UPF0280 family)